MDILYSHASNACNEDTSYLLYALAACFAAAPDHHHPEWKAVAPLRLLTVCGQKVDREYKHQ
jgi:hypothetical protein